MANKNVPMCIGATLLHEKARARTHRLLADLEAIGATGISVPHLSMIDRFRLLADFVYRALDTPEQIEETQVSRGEGLDT